MEDMRAINIPNFDELPVNKILSIVLEDEEMKKYFPDL
jgi:hypothetical protein